MPFLLVGTMEEQSLSYIFHSFVLVVSVTLVFVTCLIFTCNILGLNTGLGRRV